MERPYTPIDRGAAHLLLDLMKQATTLRAEIERTMKEVEKLRADYESLRELAGTLTVERQSPLPPLDQSDSRGSARGV